MYYPGLMVCAGQSDDTALLGDPVEFFGAEAIQDPYPLYERLRAAGHVHRIGASDFYVVSSWDAINEAIGRPTDFSSNLTATMLYTADDTVVPFEMSPLGDPTHVLATADDPAHAAHRKLLVPHLAAKRIREIEEFATDIAHSLWTEKLRDGRVEWMTAMANRLPMMVVGRPPDRRTRRRHRPACEVGVRGNATVRGPRLCGRARRSGRRDDGTRRLHRRAP